MTSKIAQLNSGHCVQEVFRKQFIFRIFQNFKYKNKLIYVISFISQEENKQKIFSK
jgi:hypothetical protein